MNRGKYMKIKTLGEGGNGTAILARDSGGRKVTIKRIKASEGPDYCAAKKSLENEAQILRGLNHPGIPQFIEYQGGYLVLEYMPGVSAEKKILQKGLFTEKEAADIALKLTDILGYLHSKKIPVIYRDLKPSNIVIGPGGKVSLIDFGTARLYRKSDRADTANLGTLGYAAPEQYGNLGQTDKRTDIYCLGMTMLQLVSGVDPRDDEMVFAYKAGGVKGISPEFLKIIDKCTRPDREDRFEDVSEVAAELRSYPGKKKLRKIRGCVKVALASAAVSFVLAFGIASAGEIQSVAAYGFEQRLPIIREKMYNVRIRIDGFMGKQLGENG
ncbi:serine/threonine protein kinase [Butyrivibrio sp. DSM 10294]|uniref:serine/threonine protein kinase n=1 Tax=Butyrivibrio sp. DSM 10294 TaxID=2972457 RepID=UPI00234FB4A6|nr:serine/threonine-protein kinase [Butyrivibrio sp. DSM 10294]MDC7292907.1 serine/threonine protein kinase [Butyrivibrio sp. DSM 10294]